MRKKKQVRLGDLQLRIMQVFWESEQRLTVSDVQRALGGRTLAYTTVATMLRKMEERDLVGHEVEGRKFLYFPTIAPGDVSGGVARDLVDRIFGGNLTSAVSHLLQSREVDVSELQELEHLIQEHKRNAKRKGR